MQFAKLKLLARALERAQVYEGGGVVVSYLLRDDFAEVGAAEPYSEGIIDYLRAVEGAELAALIREPPRGGSPARKVSLRSSVDEIDVSAIARKSGRGRPPPGGRVLERPLDRRDHRSSSSAEFVAPARARRARPEWRLIPRGLDPTGVILVDKPAGPDVVRDRRRDAPRARERGPATPARSIRSRPGCSSCSPVGPPGWQERFMDSTSGTRRTIDLRARTTTGDPEGEVVDEREPPSRPSSSTRWSALRGDVELPVPAASAVKIEGERAYRLHRRGVVVEMPLRRSRVDELTCIALRGGIATLDLLVSSGTYMRSIADALGGHCATLRRTEVGPFRVEEADAERVIAIEEALARIGVGGGAREDRPHAGAARASAARGRDRHVRRRAPRSSRRPAGGRRHRSRPDGDHVRSAPAHRARQPGRADHDARAAPRAARRMPGVETTIVAVVHAGADAARAGGVRRELPARDRSRGRRRRRRLPVRRGAVGRPRRCSSGSASEVVDVREVDGVSSTAIRQRAGRGRRRRGRADARPPVRARRRGRDG